MRVDPDIAYERVKKRNRLSEKKVTLAYIRQIHQKHEDIFVKKNNMDPVLQNTPILTLDCNQDFEENKSQCMQLTNQIQQFLAATQFDQGVQLYEL